ncbi:hypothetical protein BB560_000417 [Smittium megazygosporum]|uniref:peptidyl-tRNA hydrolase n=1 Tax=Smittium megazygosporum TaxID=133381 RepID=A0A2T9ZKC2_9FUNG|nr:hypothetical protein BB560_000417 [Smittium megazygosporum]
MTSIQPLKMYIIVRNDLIKAAHASMACIHQERNNENVIKYLNDLHSMHKVVLQAKDQEHLQKISADLDKLNIKHCMWTEQPENFSTCIATIPVTREEISPAVKKLKLFS